MLTFQAHLNCDTAGCLNERDLFIVHTDRHDIEDRARKFGWAFDGDQARCPSCALKANRPGKVTRLKPAVVESVEDVTLPQLSPSPTQP